MRASNWVTPSSGSAVRSTSAAAWAADSTAAAKSASDTGASPTSIRSLNERRCGEV